MLTRSTIDQRDADYKTLVREQEDRVRSELDDDEDDEDFDLEAYLAESRRREEALSDEERDRFYARDAFLSCWGDLWPLYADDDALLTEDETAWKKKMKQVVKEMRERCWTNVD